MGKSRKINVYDERYASVTKETPEQIEKWSKLEIPKWCDEVRFNDMELALNNTNTGHSVVYRDVFGSWGNPVVWQ